MRLCASGIVSAKPTSVPSHSVVGVQGEIEWSTGGMGIEGGVLCFVEYIVEWGSSFAECCGWRECPGAEAILCRTLFWQLKRAWRSSYRRDQVVVEIKS